MFDCPCFSLACLRAGSVRLSLALVLALLVVPGYVVVPVLFANLDSHALAGHLAGNIFHIVNRGILLLLLAVAAFWWKQGVGRWRWTMLVIVACLVGLNEFLLSPVLESLKSAMGSIDTLPAGDPKRIEFGIWHGVSFILHLFSSLVAVLLVAPGQSECGRGHCKP
ncbi:MAG: DUF4149 domain-containing protein [Mariprofundaceae bacterium]|nr:DUF4149 domain-containing protein [Mariprofundaceae bacterium]